ncbi:MAG: tetratricopeptide repeat protein [Candidatus Cloacimonetes bacterium]|nr:tetratricopeptide repeat protein [Candidatus Cloacimonadota bacterium]
MKTKSIFKRHFIVLSLSVAVACMSFVFCSCTGQNLDKTVLQAYDLRITGHADSAQVLLEQAIAKDSTNSAAWFELARTKMHIVLGNPRKLIGEMTYIQQFAQNAVDNEPNNVIYQYYLANVDFFNLYIAMRNENFSAEFEKAVGTYRTVLDLKPDYHEAKLYLIELYTMVPIEMGGDPAIAEEYVQELEAADVVFGAKAREIVMPGDADYIEFWKKIEEKQMNSADVYEALGNTYLYNENIEEAARAFEKAISLNAEKNILHINMGKYYMMQAGRDLELLVSLAPSIENEFEIYLNSQPEPVNPLKAFVIGQLAMLNFRTGDKEAGDKFKEEATLLDPNYSKAFGTPGQILFDPPDEISHAHAYFSRPF